VFVDADGSTHWYKELEVNAINTSWHLTLPQPYINSEAQWRTRHQRVAVTQASFD
jgi:hypothetical protein